VNIFRRELKAGGRALTIWTAALGVFVLMMMWIYPSMGMNAEAMEEYIDLFPEGMRKVFGLDQIKMSDPLGFYAVEGYLLVVLFGGMYAALLGSGLLAKEEEERTIEFLLARPVTRNEILAAKMAAFLAQMIIFTLAMGAITFASFEYFVAKDYSRSTLLLLVTSPLLAYLAFGGLGFLSALFFTRRRSALSAGVGMVMVLYFFQILGALSEDLQFFGYLSPFEYVDAADIVAEGALDPLGVMVLLLVAAVSAGLTFILYRRRDITI